MIAFIDDHRGAHGLGPQSGPRPICKVLPIAPSTYRAQAARRRDPGKLPARARRDAALMPEIERVFEENFRVYGVRKVWRQLKREGHDLARCTVALLMRGMGLQGVIRGKLVRTTISDKAAPCPLDHVNRQFKAPRPNALWVSDFTYVATWSGFAVSAATRLLMAGPDDQPLSLVAQRHVGAVGGLGPCAGGQVRSSICCLAPSAVGSSRGPRDWSWLFHLALRAGECLFCCKPTRAGAMCVGTLSSLARRFDHLFCREYISIIP